MYIIFAWLCNVCNASRLQYVSCDQYDKKTKYSNIFHSDIRLYSTCTLYIHVSVLLVLIYSQYFNLLKWCCYITVDSAMAASQNGFCSYNLSFNKKTNILQILTKNITIFIYLIFYHREIVKLYIILLHFPWVMQTPFCDAAVAKSTVL
jgi:hypothetical protein